MKRILMTIALAAAAALTACGDTTEPQRLGEVRIANVAPGVSAAEVNVDQRPIVAALPFRQFIYRPVTLEPHTYSFVSQTYDVEVQAPHQNRITAVLLMDPADPTAETYSLARDTEAVEQKILVVNADTAAAGLTVRLEGADTLTATVAPTEAEELQPAVGTYDVRVQRGDGEWLLLGSHVIQTGDHGFLAIHPTPAVSELPLESLLF